MMNRTRDSCRTAAGAALAAGMLLASTAHALPTAPWLPLDLARQAASAAISACAEKGYQVSAAVVNRDGVIKALLRGDGAGPHTLDSSSHKAYTSATLGESTRMLVDIVRKNPGAAGIRDMNERILILAGGLPIEVDGEIIGGIGVGGAPGGDKDEACASAGLGAIEARLE